MNESTEAPASMNFRVSYKGINVQVTNRDTATELKPYFIKAQKAIDWALENGFLPEIQKSFPKKEQKYVEGKVCPKCQGRLVERIKKDGGIYFKCENGKWDRLNNVAIGCDFVDWNNKEEKVFGKTYSGTGLETTYTAKGSKTEQTGHNFPEDDFI